MAKVVLTKTLKEEILKKFKQESEVIFTHLKTLEKHPDKGKILTNVGGTVIKEIKYTKFRFYCITDGYILKFGNKDELANLIIKFINMSAKKDQQKIINEIKEFLKLDE